MEAFVESITHLQHIEARRTVVNTFVAAQGSGKSVKDYLRDLPKKKTQPSHEESADALLSAFHAGFKGLD